MSVVQKAAWVIERNSDRDLSLGEIAENCGVSRSHLAQAFGTTGRSVMSYLRGRRLSRAAEALARGAPDILQVALDAGYSSHEAFTRAFREQFGATPEAVRERGDTAGLKLTPAIDIVPSERREKLTSRLEDEKRLLVVGMAERFACGASLGITALWQRFEPFMEAVPFKKEAMPIGVTRNHDEDGGFEYIAGLEVTRFGDTPPQLIAIEIPAHRYAVFTHIGHVTRFPDTFRIIWDEALPALGASPVEAPVLERHLPTFDPRTGEGGIEVWVPVKGAG
jgi:AraC family transcriptional regulator